MIYDILTLFPNIIDSLKDYGVIKKAIDKKLIEINSINIRDFTLDKHKKVDDTVYGGGSGMLMTCQPIYDALLSVKSKDSKTIFLSPQGRVLDQKICRELAKEKHLILLCGHYEGIDARITNNYVDMEISIGDYVLTGGELPAMVLIDSVSRMIEDVLGNKESYETDSHYNLLLQNDEYTKPRSFLNHQVPDVLLSGNHQLIEEWKLKNSIENTKRKRPDIYERYLKLGGKDGNN